MNAPANFPLSSRIDGIDWTAARTALLDRGFATLGPLLSRAECEGLQAGFDDEAGFRSHIHMARHGFGMGEYKYYSYPLPNLIGDLRAGLYEQLVPAAETWAERLGVEASYPANHADYAALCHANGQVRPTPLVLRYKAGDYNRLHQDLYGDIYFPFQVAVLLSEPGRDFEGGEFVLVENTPRMQSRTSVIPLRQGEAVVFAVNERPRLGSRGYHRATLRHGVSDILSGHRATLGIIFHDAR